ncbi:nucleolar protein,Nop52-domain-containing protein [Naematelia encephala]|uniref:Nucleolar protein,Nop52-domain-containing protein n=1 Tax=Naematelia encephala TaxID=71784 RepID=A0A1Y2BIW1_9TREE|nr:nucleolar protein,Nop52-domain-containing protein [Naematelia encephala]
MSTTTLTRKSKGKSRATQNDKVEAALPLGKQLAHTDKQVRDRAIASLVAFVSAGAQDGGPSTSSAGYTPLAEGEMDKLWKGLFYCFWMSDKPLVQQSLASDLAELVLKIQPRPARSKGINLSEEKIELDDERFDAALGFLAGFWRSMVREWHGIDRLRVDKFYMLIRRYVNATFRLLARGGWKEEQVGRVNDVLAGKGGPITVDVSVPKALAGHLSDIYLEELDKVLGLPEVDAQRACPTLSVLGPHIALLALTPTQSIYNRTMSTVFTPLLSALTLASPSTKDIVDRPSKRSKDDPIFPHIVMRSRLAGSDQLASPDKLRKGLVKALFEAAADQSAVETNRRKIYQIVRELDDDEDEDEDA